MLLLKSSVFVLVLFCFICGFSYINFYDITFLFLNCSLQVLFASTRREWPNILSSLRSSTATIPTGRATKVGSRRSGVGLHGCSRSLARRTAQAQALCRSPSFVYVFEMSTYFRSNISSPGDEDVHSSTLFHLKPPSNAVTCRLDGCFTTRTQPRPM